MRCPSCGSLLPTGLETCLECQIPASSGEATTHETSTDATLSDLAETLTERTRPSKQTSRLIEFPGVSRNSLPQWRKELSERVREVQEKRAREAALEAPEVERRGMVEPEAASAPQLELLPQAEVQPLNPLVSAALRRIERAHQQATQSVGRMNNTPAIAAVAYAAESHYQSESFPEHEMAAFAAPTDRQIHDRIPEPETLASDKVHNLVVVPPRATQTETPKPRTKPRRMIADDPNDPALNYLDSVPRTLRVDDINRNQAPVVSRVLGAIVDLIVVLLLSAPFAALVELADGNWQDLRVMVSAGAVFTVMGFLYLTISTALTGRTLGTRLFSLRIVDARTGLIPTGKQSAGRALIYLATLLTLGLASLHALLDRDKRTIHDRLTSTAVITV
ncbi:MAG: RDD family protein [Pyrinomonadaceae bacterium]